MVCRVIFGSVFAGSHKKQKSVPPASPQGAVFVLLCASLTFSSVAFAQQGTFIPTGSMNTARVGPAATLLKNGMVLIAGGASTTDTSAELYDPAKGTFSLTGSMNVARSGFTATLLNSGMVLIVAGGDSTGTYLASAELYDPATGTFSLTGSVNVARSRPTATLLNNGMVLVAGGVTPVVGCSVACTGYATASVELYDPATGTFRTTGSLNTGRFFHMATLLNNGMVLVVGGDGGCAHPCSLASAELYNPATGTFSLTGSLSTPLEGPTATLLNDGTVLVAGGFNSGFGATSSAELYDPATGTFTSTGSMTRPRELHTATLLSNGTVLVAGGDYQMGPLALADSYDPTTRTFGATGSMNTARNQHAATLLNNGTVLVAGGCCNAAPSSAELYEPVAVIPASLSFANQPVGMTSAPQTLTVTNNGSTALTITGLSVNGANPSDFAETNTCLGSLPAATSCSINVTFTPPGTGNFVASLAIANNLSLSPLALPLSGTGVAVTRIASLSPSSVTFAGVVLGATGTGQSITVTNTGNTALIVSAVAITGANGSDFAETDTCVGSLAPAASCTINITFAPDATGTRTGTLSITDDATSPQSPQTVALSGIGQDFSMTAATPTATVAAGQTATYSVSVSPAGGFNQTVSLNCTGTPSLSTCTVFPNLVTLNGTSATPVTLSVSTTAPALILPEFPRMGPPRMVNFLGPVLLLSLLLSLILLTRLIRDRRETQRSMAPVLSLFRVVLAGITLVACGGGGSAPRTPPGTYSLTVSGTFNYGSTTLAHNAKLTLVVQ